jgi:hypothetical protein
VNLSDSIVLKKQGRKLVLNEKVEGKDYWDTYLIERQKNGNLKVYAVGNFETKYSTNQQTEFDGKLEDYFSITSFEELDSSKYLVNPTAKEFKKLIEKGLFIEQDEYKRIPGF